MKVLKFGGTSVGSAERMKNLVPLINSAEPKIVVLSAMSGTTNSLVEIANALYSKENDQAKKLINALEKKYEAVIKELFLSPHEKGSKGGFKKSQELIKNHFEFIRSFTLDLFTANEEKAILAQGELLSTSLVHFYLHLVNSGFGGAEDFKNVRIHYHDLILFRNVLPYVQNKSCKCCVFV